MFLEGIILMLVGMGTVFLFLALLVLVTSRSGALIHRFEEKTAQAKAE